MELNRANYPKLFKAFESYLIRVSNSKPEVFENINMDHLITTGLLQYGSVVYFFDEVNIIVSVWNPGQGWKWRVNSTFPMEGSGLSRKDAESKAIIEACNRFEK